MDEILDQIRDVAEAPIVCADSLLSPKSLTESQDFQGQRLASLINYALLSTFGVRRGKLCWRFIDLT
jgi:hypothetical protein